MLQEHKKLERLMLFSEVAQALSFTLAADTLGISRGHLSSQIKRLEKDMGLPLLIRSTRSVRLTDAGKRVLAGTEKIRLSLLELERNAVHEGQTIEGLIKITAPLLFTEHFLLDICAEFKQQHPGIRFSIDSSYTQYDLHRSNFDLAFRATETPPDNMIAKALLSYRHCCVASAEYLARYGTPLVPEDIQQHQCIRGQDQPYWQFDQQAIAANGWLQINDNNLLKRQALAGQGLIRVADYLVAKEVADGLLIRVLEDYMPSGRQIFMVHPQLIHQSKRLSAFIAFTKARFL